MAGEGQGLVGDIGGTNARFALVGSDGAISRFASIPCARHESMAAVIGDYLANAGASPSRAVLAVATSPAGDRVSFTNLPWSFSIADLTARLRLQRLEVINDFHANALAIPHLKPDDVIKLGGGEPVAGAAVGIIGPGSGLGVSALAATPHGLVPIVGEGGHVTMAAGDDEESAVLALLRRDLGHVSAERVLSGPGLLNLYAAICALDGVDAAQPSAAEVTDAALAGRDTRAARALDMFCAMLGTVAADLALTLGARGGIYIAGGIVPRLEAAFARSPFRRRFEDKGRFSAFLASIPTYVIRRPDTALLGAASLLRAGD